MPADKPILMRPKKHNGFCPPPGYVDPYRSRHKSLTSTLRNEEHETFKARAHAQGVTPTELATKLLREYLAREIPMVPADNFEDATEVYGDGKP